MSAAALSRDWRETKDGSWAVLAFASPVMRGLPVSASSCEGPHLLRTWLPAELQGKLGGNSSAN